MGHHTCLRESEKIPENAKSVFILTPSLQKDCLINCEYKKPLFEIRSENCNTRKVQFPAIFAIQTFFLAKYLKIENQLRVQVYRLKQTVYK